MEWSFVVLVWLTSLVVTILAFTFNTASRRDKHPVLFLLAFVLWASCSVTTQQVHYVGFGSQNAIIYDHEAGDWSGDVGLMYMLYMLALVNLVYFLWSVLRMGREELMDVDAGRKRYPV